HTLASGKQRAIRAQSDNHSPNAASQKLARTALSIVNIAYRHPGNRLSLALVGNKVIEVRDRIDVDRLRGSRVQDAADAVLPRKLDGVVHGFQRDLELEDDTVGVLQRSCGGIHVGRFQRVIRAFDDDDPILSRGIDENRRYSTRNTAYLPHMRGIDAKFFKVLDG